MLGLPADTKNEAKCHVTHGLMGHLDPKQPPTKRKPFVNILKYGFIQQVQLILPEELYEITKKTILTDRARPTYSRVILPLNALLEGEFFDEYIKKGNILMLSEAGAGVDRVYSLREGILTLYLDKEGYERAGLVGKPDGVKGKRGTKPRWVVEINLRLPSMLHGKKGFDRIVHAFKNVLCSPVTWLFCDLAATTIVPAPVDIHFPIKKSVDPEVLLNINVGMPPLNPPSTNNLQYEGDFEDYATETHELFSLICLNSRRIDPKDSIDPFISRYYPPGGANTESKLVKITWRGFLPPCWVHRTFVDLLLEAPRERWFALSIVAFGDGWAGDSKDCTILKPPDTLDEYVIWEIAQ